MSLGQKLLFPAVMVLVLAAHACSRSQSPPVPDGTGPVSTATPSPTPTPINPQALLELSGKTMEGLDSFHFHLEHENGGTPLVQNLVLLEADGDVVRPDKISLEFAGSVGNFAVKATLITLGDETYMTNPLTGDWETLPAGVSPLSFFNPTQGISAMMSQVQRATLLSSSKDTYRIGGALPAQALASLFGATVEGSTISVELEIDARDFYLLEAVLDGRITSSEPEGVARIIKLSRFNEPVVIEPPQ